MKVSSSGALVEKKPEMIFMWVQVGHGIHSSDSPGDWDVEEDERAGKEEVKKEEEEERCRHQNELKSLCPAHSPIPPPLACFSRHHFHSKINTH